MPGFSLLAICAVLLLVSAACPRTSHPAPAGDVDPGVCRLEYADGILRLVAEGRQLAQLESADAVPYRIVRASDPAIVTTCGADLVPRTWTLGSQAYRFDDVLPQLVEPPVIALFALGAEEDTPGGRVLLVGPDGAPLWEHPQAQLLLPAIGQPGSPVLAAPTAGSFFTPFGDTPMLIAIDPVTGEEAWQVELPVRGAPDDIELLCSTGGYGLLVVQYGYTIFHYLSVDLSDGETAELYRLGGQPFVTIVQPGAMPVYRELAAEGTTAELLAFDEARGAGLLSFDLAGSTTQFAERDVTGPAITERNKLPVGGGLAQPDSPPFPQSLLPMEYGPEWDIPALIDGDQCLVIDGDGAAWVKF